MDNAVVVGSVPAVVVSGQQLRAWEQARIDATEFRCQGCPVAMVPRAYRPTHKVQGHFSTWPGENHHDCDLVSEVASPSDSDQAGTVRCRNVVWPIRLVDDEPRKVRGRDADRQQLPPAVDRRETTRRNLPGNEGAGDATAKTVRPFALAYRDMTHEERRQTPIDLPGIDAERYQYAFKRLPQWEIQELPSGRVFHGPLRYTGEIRDEGGAFLVELHAGGEFASGRFGAPWTLVLAHSDWTPRSRALLVDEFESACHESRDKKKAAWVYALAHQDKKRPNLLHVERRSHIAFIMD